MFTDADIEMAEMEAVARSVAGGACAACDEALDPYLPKWASYWTPRNTPEMVAACYGPESPDYPGYHTNCIEGYWEDN
jgi:hypothetical protein